MHNCSLKIHRRRYEKIIQLIYFLLCGNFDCHLFYLFVDKKENRRLDMKELEKELKKRKLSPKETEIILKGLRAHNSWKKYMPVKIDFPDRHVRFGVFSDAHIGHQCYRPDALRKLAVDCKKKGMEFILNGGDTLEGMSGREGHIYELTHLGASEQLKYFASEFSVFDRAIYSIEAQNSHGGWFNSKGNAGLNIGEEMANRCSNYKFIGYDEQDIEMDNGLKIRLRHPGGGTAYAISYKMQKYIESISGGKKPHLLCQAHFHKAQYMFYRNVHGFDCGCLCNQTPFMRKIGTPAHVGYWLIDANMNKKKNEGIERVNFQFIPFYE